MNGIIISTEFKKAIHLLKDLYQQSSPVMFEFIGASDFELERHHNTTLSPEWKAFNLNIRTYHTIYLKYYDRIDSISSLFKKDINKISSLTIDRIRILPDYENFQIIESTIRPILTDWEEINLGQTKLLEQLSSSSDSLDLQNIGNTSRIILQQLSSIVYKDEIHNPNNPSISVTPDKFKNRLTSYIIKELEGESNMELRNFAKAAIVTVEKSIDLANTVTHKFGVERTFAEVCVIGTIGAISIIKLIQKQRS